MEIVMTYGSTRGTVQGVSFSDAVLMGIAPDGGLFVPEREVHFDSLDLANMSALSYQELACEIIKEFATDFTPEEIARCVENAYGRGSRSGFVFPEEVAPLTRLSSSLNVLELWHGPTCAFKDMALQILPEFMAVAAKKGNKQEKIVILTATSGDTGKAALEGFRDAEGIRVIVFYPVDGVSEMQKQQMITQEGGNVYVAAVKGNFDDAQTGVKQIFGDFAYTAQLKERGYSLSSANSINFGRLLPQIIYYFYGYFTLVRRNELSLGARVNFVVPTGNFGNILAAYYAMKCGLPVNKIICATNTNDVVSNFMTTGTYDSNRRFVTTISPAMDILISSNLERLLYDISGNDSIMTSHVMRSLKEHGVYSVDKRTINNVNHHFWSASASESETKETIENVYREYQYLIDPHTAVGIDVYDKYVISTGDVTKTIAVSTASPFKFNRSVAEAIWGEDIVDHMDEFQILSYLSEKTGLNIPRPLQGLDKKPVRFSDQYEKAEMKAAVDRFLN